MVSGGVLRHTLCAVGTLLSAGIGAVSAASVDSTILILARDSASASSASSGLDGYGIPFENLIVPQEGIDLPTLNSSTANGNYGGIIVMGAVSYDYDGVWKSAVTEDQWDAIHAYQDTFHVRMVRIDEYPGPVFGEFITAPYNRLNTNLWQRLCCCH